MGSNLAQGSDDVFGVGDETGVWRCDRRSVSGDRCGVSTSGSMGNVDENTDGAGGVTDVLRSACKSSPQQDTSDSGFVSQKCRVVDTLGCIARNNMFIKVSMT